MRSDYAAWIGDISRLNNYRKLYVEIVKIKRTRFLLMFIDLSVSGQRGTQTTLCRREESRLWK